MNLSFVFLQAAGGGDYSFLIMMVAIFDLPGIVMPWFLRLRNFFSHSSCLPA